MESSDDHGIPKNKHKQTKGKESTSGGSTQDRHLPTNIKTRPSTQAETAKGDTEKTNQGKAQGKTQRFSPRRKRPNDKRPNSFSVAAGSQTEVREQDNTREEIKTKSGASNSSEKPCSRSQKNSEGLKERGGQNIQQNRDKAKKNVTVSKGERTPSQKDSATVKEVESQKEVKKQGREVQQNKREVRTNVTVKSSDSALPQSNQPDCTTRRESETKGGTQKQGQKIPQNNSVVVGSKDLKDSATGKDSKLQDETRKQGRSMPKSGLEAKKMVDVDRSSKTLSQNSPQDSAAGKQNKIQDGTKRQRERIPQNRREAKKNAVVDLKDKALSQNSFGDGATEIESDSRYGTRKQKQERPKPKRDAMKSAVADKNDKTLSQNGLQIATDVTRKENNFLEGTFRQQQKHSAVVVSEDKSMLPTKPRNSATGKESKVRREGRKQGQVIPQNRSVVNNKDKTLPQNRMRSDAAGKECKSQDETRKQVGTSPDNGKEAEKSATVNGNNALPRKAREPSKRGFQSKGEAKKSVAVYSNENKLSQRGVEGELTGIKSDRQSNESVAVGTNNDPLSQKDDATGKQRKSFNRTRKRNQKRRQSESEAKKGVAKDSTDNALIQKSGGDCATELARKSEDGAQQGKTRHQKKDKGKKSVDVSNNGKVLRQNVLQDGETRRESERQTDTVVFSKSNTGSQTSAQERATGQQSKQSRPEVGQTSTKRKERKAIGKKSEPKSFSIEAMKGLLESTPNEIVHRLTLEQSSLLVKQQNMTNDAVIVLMRLVRKACDCDSHAALLQLLGFLQTSWFLTGRVAAMLDQLVVKKSKIPQAEGVNLDAIRDLVKLLTDVFSRFQNSCPSALLLKLQNASMALVKSGKLLDKDVMVTIQEIRRLKKEEESTSKQQTTRRDEPFRAANTNGNRKPPENFRDLSVIPTTSDITAVPSHGQEHFLRKNKIKGRYNDEEHYLDVQFRLLREDFVRPLRDGIQQLMNNPGCNNVPDDRLQDVRIYENVKILYPVCTSSGVRYKVKFDTSKFHRVQWENSKRLIFGSLLCLSKDNFENFVFATVAERKDVRKGEIEVRFVQAASEARTRTVRTGDFYQMVESIAFFEAYRPVLEGLQMMSPGNFPLKSYIVDCHKDVRPPAYLKKRDGQKVVFDFSPIVPSKETPSSTLLQESTNHSEGEVSDNWELSPTLNTGYGVTVLDPASWPSANDLELDDSQFDALQLALTKEFAVIQGPPGTGKTYIGLKIAKILLHNQTAWSRNGQTSPILVVCYTNHALDQFLEGILEFHPNGIIRVGGRSQSEKIQGCSLSKLKKENNLTPKRLKKAFGKIRQEMKGLSEIIYERHRMYQELKRTLFHEDKLRNANSMTSKQYDSLVRKSDPVTAERKESVIPQWLGLPVQPPDPYQDGFAQPLVMFPFNAECWDLEFFSQYELASISENVRIADGPYGNSGGSLELAGEPDSFIEIPNAYEGPVDARGSFTLLAFVYPMGSGGPIVSYHINGLGLRLSWHKRFNANMGILSASFVRRDLVAADDSLTAPVLKMNDWNFVGASYDYNSGMARLWHNGNEVKAVNIGENLELATQFSVRIGAVDNPQQENSEFKGRISHLHIYADALTAENIRAVGGISKEGRDREGTGTGGNEGTRAEEEHEQETEEDPAESVNAIEGSKLEENGQKWKSPDFQFDADVMENHRILDTDDIIRFDTRSSLDKASSDDLRLPSKGTEGDNQSGRWQFQNARRVRRKINTIVQRELKRKDVMSYKEAVEVGDVWNLSEKDRWRLYRRWVYDACESCYETISHFQDLFDDKAIDLQELRNKEDYEILRKADVIGMTTTGAARYHSVLQDLKPAITIVEEAAEVFEAHTVTSLTPGCQHLILIGDHQQLRPSPTVYDLQINYALDVSLFERMINNGLQFKRLCLQHRMRPEIAKMLDHIYVNPKLKNHESVLKFEDIKGVGLKRNLFFVDHDKEEDFIHEGKSKSNDHEATFLTALCRYFIQQGYQREKITILTAYSGQLLKLKREMSKEEGFFEGVRVTSVDNFQGEENDIILLSLVRSKRIGFLKIANRVCVGLSRARKGFYMIGNAKLLEEQDPDLWRKIIADMREQENLGKQLTLVCQNHPQNVIQASRADDFLNAPLGGCMEPCLMSMPDCEHTCPSVCHPIDVEHKKEFACPLPCTKIICERGHQCPKICSEECDPCVVRVPKLIPGCGHEQDVPCSMDPSQFKCMQVVSKRASPCGHSNDVRCWRAPCDIVCKEPCVELECGHPCPGNCSECQQGRLHLPCESSCGRTLFCGHTCKADCIRACPPCVELCKRCGRICGHPYQLSTYECKWQCPHHPKCTETCEEQFKRQRCDQPCEKQIACGHPCIGVCGEVCPKLCRVCHNDAVEFSEGQPGTMFVELADCGHVIEVKTLNQWMNNSEGEQGENEDVEIKLKRCPKCSFPILCGPCNGNIVKNALTNFEAVKRRIFLSAAASNVQIKKIRNELRELKDMEMKVAESIEQDITSSPLTPEQLSKHQNQVAFLTFLGNLVRKYKNIIDTNKELDKRISLLVSRIMKRRLCFSEQEIKEFIEELSRTKLLVCLKCLMTTLGHRAITLSPEDTGSLDTIKNDLDSGKTIGHRRRQEFMADINRVSLKHGLSSDVEATDSDSELKNMIVKTKNLAQGPWYKCNKAHVYSAAERFEGGGSIKCPDCLAASRETFRTSAEAVPAQVRMRSSNRRSMAPKPTFAPGARNERRRRSNKNPKFRK